MKYLLISLLLILGSFFGLTKGLEDFAVYLMRPFQSGTHSLALEVQSSMQFLEDISLIYGENQKLKKELLEINELRSRIADLEEENEVLREQFLDRDSPDSGWFDHSSGKLVLAEVLGVAGDLAGNTIYINVGTRSGLRPDSVVIYRNYLVGRVVEVDKHRSLVSLISSPETVVAVRNVDAPGLTEGVLSGDYGTVLRLTRVLQEEPLNKGDLLVTSGREGIFPPGLLVGEVQEVDAVATEPLKSATVSPLIDLKRLNRVFVLPDPGNSVPNP